MKIKYLAGIIFSFIICGCHFHGNYMPIETGSYKIIKNEIKYETDTLKLLVNSGFVRIGYEQYTFADLKIFPKNQNLQANFYKTELHTERAVQKNYVSEITGEKPTDGKVWFFEKGKEYSFSVHFTAKDTSFLSGKPFMERIGINMSKVFQSNNNPVSMPEFYFIGENE